MGAEVVVKVVVVVEPVGVGRGVEVERVEVRVVVRVDCGAGSVAEEGGGAVGAQGGWVKEVSTVGVGKTVGSVTVEVERVVAVVVWMGVSSRRE